MKFSELTTDQKGAIYPIFQDVWTDENLNGFLIQLHQLTIDSKKSRKGTQKELNVIDQLFNCISTICGANSETNLQKSVTQLVDCFPIFIDLICSEDLEKASYTFEKCANELVWYNILNQKRKIYQSLVTFHELQINDKVKQKIAA